MDLRSTARDVLEGFGRHRVLTYASAIAYQVLSSLIPFALFALGLAGTLGAESLWTQHLRPEVQQSTSIEVFQLLDKTVGQILAHKQTFWATFGLLVVLWEVGGAVRATMEALDDIYGIEDGRGRRDKYVTSTWLAAVVGLLWLGVFVLLLSGGGVLGLAVRYAGAALLLSAAVWAMVRVAPAQRQPVRFVSRGSAAIVVGWLVVVGGYVFYATSIASYGSAFGSLAAAFVLIVAVYLSAVVFLTGVLLDAKARDAS